MGVVCSPRRCFVRSSCSSWCLCVLCSCSSLCSGFVLVGVCVLVLLCVIDLVLVAVWL